MRTFCRPNGTTVNQKKRSNAALLPAKWVAKVESRNSRCQRQSEQLLDTSLRLRLPLTS
jgi:hypothetical protein